MKTQSELESIACNLHHNAINVALLRDYIPQAVKDLRSIELDAWREARSLVEKLPRSHYGEIRSRELIGAMDLLIQQLQLK